MPALLIAAMLVAIPAPHDACANALIQQTAAAGTLHGRKLGDLPPGHLMRAVLRRIDGCEFAEVRQASGAWTNVPAGRVAPYAEPARRAPSTEQPASPAR